MRHGKRFNHLGRTAPHRKAMLSNMASSLILNKRIFTTLAKAKALRKYVEPLLTKSKENTTHSRRTVFSYLQNKESMKVLFDEVAVKIADRPGGYTRIIRTGSRLGDNAEMCMMELVDYNELLLEETETKTKTRRGGRRRSRSKKKSQETSSKTSSTDSATESSDKEVASDKELKQDKSPEETEKSPESETKTEDKSESKEEIKTGSKSEEEKKSGEVKAKKEEGEKAVEDKKEDNEEKNEESKSSKSK